MVLSPTSGGAVQRVFLSYAKGAKRVSLSEVEKELPQLIRSLKAEDA